MPRYQTSEQFRTLMRQGRLPDGSASGPCRPSSTLKNMNDTDVDALYVFLKSASRQEP